MKDFFRNNGVLILIAAILLALVTAVVSALLGGGANPLANLVNIVTTPVRSGISAVAGWAEEKYNDTFELEQMKEELETLRQRVAELEAKERKYEAALQENERLRDFAGLRPSSLSFDPESATVTERSTSNWNSTLTISKGSSMGIAVDDVVVDQYWNLVGVVAEVGENWATVRTLVDVGTEMGGQIARTGSAAILEGILPSWGGQAEADLSAGEQRAHVRGSDHHLRPGRRVSPGLAAGHVEEVRTDPRA